MEGVAPTKEGTAPPGAEEGFAPTGAEEGFAPLRRT
jgi:hypothetical protein